MGDLLDTPGRAPSEITSPTRDWDHFLVEFMPPVVLAHDEDRNSPQVGDSAAGDHRGALYALPCGEHVGGAVPTMRGRSCAKSSIRWRPDNIIEHGARPRVSEVAYSGCATDHVEQFVDVPVGHRDHRDDLLG